MGVLRSMCRVVVVFMSVVVSATVVAAGDNPVEAGNRSNDPGLSPDDTSWMSSDYAELAKATETSQWSTCTPARVGVFTNRVHVRCTSANAGILYYAFSTNDQAAVARVLALLNSAILTGRTLTILNDPADTTSGPPVGCLASDCRLILALEIL